MIILTEEGLIFNDYRDASKIWNNKTKLRELPNYTPQRRNVNNSTYSIGDRKICGADTETLGGKIWLFSTEYGVWEVEDLGQLLEVIFNKEHSYRYSRLSKAKRKKSKATNLHITTKEFFFWNLKFDASAIMKTFSEKEIETILEFDKLVTVCKFKGEDMTVEITYLEGKYMEIKPVKFFIDGYKYGAVKFWDISQFYYKMRLDVAGKKYLGIGKMETCFDGTKLDVSRLEEIIRVEDMNTGEMMQLPYYEYYRKDIEKYAILDAKLAGDLTRLKKKQFNDSGIRFSNPYSLANVSQKHLLENYEVPSLNPYVYAEGLHGNIANWILKFAFTCYTGGWFEVCGNGFVDENVSAWDLASAYPYVQYHLDDTSKGEWYVSNSRESFDELIKETYPMQLGFVEAFIKFPKENNWNPLTRKSDLGTLISPNMIQGIFTLDEIKEAMKWSPEILEIGEFCIFYPSTENKPFRPFINKFYGIKMTSDKSTADYATSKVLLNSIYGKKIQNTKGKAGKMFNPIYASVITAYTRVRLAEMMRLNNQKVLSLATDGVVLNNENPVIPKLELPACYNLGEWENEVNDGIELAFVCIQSGVYSLIDKNTGEPYKHTFRGSASYFLREHKNCKTFLEDNSDKSKIEKSIYKPYSIRESRVKSDYALINIFALRKYSISVMGDSTKRIREIEPQKFGDLLNSWFPTKPHSSSMAHSIIAEMIENEPKKALIIVKGDDIEYELDDDLEGFYEHENE